jgi:hypothetical protein
LAIAKCTCETAWQFDAVSTSIHLLHGICMLYDRSEVSDAGIDQQQFLVRIMNHPRRHPFLTSIPLLLGGRVTNYTILSSLAAGRFSKNFFVSFFA